MWRGETMRELREVVQLQAAPPVHPPKTPLVVPKFQDCPSKGFDDWKSPCQRGPKTFNVFDITTKIPIFPKPPALDTAAASSGPAAPAWGRQRLYLDGWMFPPSFREQLVVCFFFPGF